MPFDLPPFHPRHRVYTRVLLATCLLGAAGTLGCSDEPSGPIAELEKDLDAASFSLAEAVNAVQRVAPDGTIIDAKLEYEKEPLEYRFELYEQGFERRLGLLASDGSVTENSFDELDPDDAVELASLAAVVDSAQITIEEAIAIAENNTGGRAFDFAAVEDRVFELEVLADGRVYELEIDPVSGEILEQHIDDTW